MGARERVVDPVDPIDAALLDRWQHGFPIAAEPFAVVATATGRSVDDVLARFARLHAAGTFDRIGPVWAVGAGGAGMLAAYAVPDERFDAVAARVSAEPAVNHNYRRAHPVNLWFVVTAPDAASRDAVVDRLDAETGLIALRLPMRRAYRIDLGFPLDGEGGTSGRAMGPCGRGPSRAAPAPVAAADRPLAAAIEAGLPLVPRPWDEVAAACGRDADDAMRTVARWIADGTVRRFGVVVRHHELGWAHNAMAVWRVDGDDAAVDAAGLRLAAQPGVTLAYRRERAPGWPYDLYAMVHGRDPESVRAAVTAATHAAGLATAPHALLFSTARLKQQAGHWFRAPTPTPHRGQVSTRGPDPHAQRGQVAVRGPDPNGGVEPGRADRRLIARLHGGFALVERPFAVAGAGLGMTEGEVIERLRRLLHEGWLTRFGPLFQIERAGGRFVLAAVAVSADRVDAVAAAINARPEVAHNYRRTHALNLWFVVAAETPAAADAALAAIEADTGCAVFAFPKEREYAVELRLPIDPDAPASPPPPAQPVRHDVPVRPLDPVDRRLVQATQAGLPLVDRPYDAIGQTLGLAGAEVRERLAAMLADGRIRRIGAVPHHVKLGFVANGMTVWDVADDRVDALGEAVARIPGVSHCYRRPRRLPHWRFNLFAMLHGRGRHEVEARRRILRDVLGDALRADDVLYSTAVLKKTGLRLVEG